MRKHLLVITTALALAAITLTGYGQSNTVVTVTNTVTITSTNDIYDDIGAVLGKLGLSSNPSNYASLTDASYQSMRTGWDQEERSVLIENRTVQNQTYLNLQPTAQRIQSYVEHSNSASGATSAMQAGNEEVATLVAQVQALQAQEITDARAEVQRDAQDQAEQAYAEQQRQSVRGDWSNPQQPTSSIVNAFPAADQ